MWFYYLNKKTIYTYVYVYLRFYYYPNLRFECTYNIYRPFRSMALRRPQHLYHVGLGREPSGPRAVGGFLSRRPWPWFLCFFFFNGDITLGYYMILPSIWGYDYGYNYGDITIILLCYHPLRYWLSLIIWGYIWIYISNITIYVIVILL